MTSYDRNETALPGLEPPQGAEVQIVSAARRSIAALAADGLLDERHSLLCQGILDMSAVTADAVRTGKAAAAAMSFAQILAAYDRLPTPPEGGGDVDPWEELAAQFRAAAERDPAQP